MGGEVPSRRRLGGRKELADETLSAVVKAPRERVRELFLPHLDMYAARIVEGVRLGERHCLNTFGKVLDIIDESETVAIAILTNRGLSSEGELDRKLGLLMDAETADETQLWRLAEAYAMDYRRRKGLPLLIEGREVQ